MANKFGKYLGTYINKLTRINDIWKELIAQLTKKITRMEDQSVITSEKTNFE